MTEEKSFTPINGVIVEVEKITNKAGIEVQGDEKPKNEGKILKSGLVTKKAEVEFSAILSHLSEGKKIKFTEGFVIDENKFFVELKNIIGIF